MLAAHETLIAIDDENADRFGAVVSMTQQDLDRLKDSGK